MNIAALAASALRRAPPSARGPVVFTATDGSTATGTAVGVPAHGSPADGFKAQQMIRDKARVLSVLPEGLAFAPLAGMKATWGAVDYAVLAVSPLAPDGATLALYRVTLSR
jgi:hypothetical protein